MTATQATPAVSRDRARILLLIGLTAATVLAVFLLPRIAQDPSYHDFADQRTLIGIANALNVVSNLPFLLAGIAGLVLLRSRASHTSFQSPAERLPYVFFFVGVAMTCAGSSYYHLLPSNDRLLWDRLPMAVAFMALFTAVIAERINLRAGLILLFPLIAAGLGSVVYWHLTEQAGRGDLRPYVVVQFYSMAAVAFIAGLFKSRYTHASAIFVSVGIYGVAKVFELCDALLLRLSGISGHSLKHVAAALSAYWIVRMLKKRARAAL
jgi:hypothetical protein